ncbi:hypothetical protein KY332_03755 [Candidatus Woesearchaeota archaeon]|nr:hypothetical protein [Candidatus Woesearchaeota archaeon]
MVKYTYLLNRLTLVFLVVLVSGCGMTAMVEQDITLVVRDEGGVEDVYFCPRENCSKVFEEFGGDCAFFDLELGIKADRLIVDSDHIVEGAKGDNRSAFMHNKFCISGDRILSGSTNPTFNGVNKNNNNLIIIKSEKLAENYRDEFEEMWNGDFGKGEKTRNKIIDLNGTRIENYFCPEDDCGERIEEALSEAEESIYFLTFSFTHTGIANEVVKRLHDGVEVKGVFEKRGAGSEYSRFKLLKYQGADVRKDTNGGTMHHKVFIIDNNTVITGSFNPSKNADTRNDENVLIIHDKDVAERYLEEFLYVWENFSE